METQPHHIHGGEGEASTGFNDAFFNLHRKTSLELQTLENLYSDDKHPMQSRMEGYASALGLTYAQVRRWYIERRRRDKVSTARSKAGSKSAGRTVKRKCNPKNKKGVSDSAPVKGNSGGRPFLIQDMLYSPDYILQKVFRKDGPPLGVEFDSLPASAFGGRHVSQDSRSAHTACQDEQRASKRRKVSKPAMLDSQRLSQTKAPVKKHGMGKGLISVLQLVNSQPSRWDNIRAPKRKEVIPGEKISLKKHGMGKGLMTVLQLANRDTKNVRERRPQRRKPLSQQRNLGTKLQEKRRPPVRRRKVDSTRDEIQKARRESCKLALDLASYEENLSLFALLADDEELEMRELQAGPNPVTCSAHFTSSGTLGCSLCKGLLPKFPPNSIRMKNPLSFRPWNSSLELVKKLFKVFHFLYTYAVIIDVCPFTFNEFVQAFHEKDSLLLGKLHMCLLEFLLSDIERKLNSGLSVHSRNSSMFLNLLQAAEDRKFALNDWKASLNSLTWTEIMRQVLVAAGFGSKDGSSRKGCLNKEADHIMKYGLSPGTLKGEVFSILLEHGNKGMNVSELANSPRIVDLNLQNMNGQLEDVVCSTLAGDITLFEKISSSAYRVRLTSMMKKDEDALLDNEDCGSIDDESRDHMIHSTSECSSGNPTSRLDSRRHSVESNALISTEIDESHPGESWLLGLLEGEYCNLSIEEKLNAFMALVDLLSSGPSIRMEDPPMTLAECVPSIYQHASGGKIKPSSLRQLSMPTSCSLSGTYDVDTMHQSSEVRPVDSSVCPSMPCWKEKSSAAKKCSNRSRIRDDLHSMQSIFLGSDRRYNRYWLFLGLCDTDDPGHTRVYFESSEDGHWEVIDSEQALHDLLGALDSRGRREASLLASLEKRIEVLLDEMNSRTGTDAGVCEPAHSDISEIDRVNDGSPSPLSDVDTNLSLAETSCSTVASIGAAGFEDEKKVEEQKEKFARQQAYDLWIWDSYSGLHTVKHGKKLYFDSLTRCGRCNDLYWRDERHCKTCHTTFELDFDLEEKYAIHLATCQGPGNADICPAHKVLSSQLQALKAAIHAIELVMPDDSLAGAWKKSAHNLWVRRLRRTTSLNELLQVISNFVGAINVDWLAQCNVTHDYDYRLEDIVACFQNMPQTPSAVALWLVKLDSFIAPHLSEGLEVGTTKGKGKR